MTKHEVTFAYVNDSTPVVEVTFNIQGVQVKVSDLSDAMELPRPGVTRTVKEMEEKEYLQKIASEEDGRVTYITVTKKGSELSQKYDEQYFDSLLIYCHGRICTSNLSTDAGSERSG